MEIVTDGVTAFGMVIVLLDTVITDEQEEVKVISTLIWVSGVNGPTVKEGLLVPWFIPFTNH